MSAQEGDDEDSAINALFDVFKANWLCLARDITSERSHAIRCTALFRLPGNMRDALDDGLRAMSVDRNVNDLNAQEEVLCQLMINYLIAVFQVIRERNAQ